MTPALADAMPLAASVPRAPDGDARLRRRRRQRMQMLAMIAGSYAVDVTLMAALAATGAIVFAIPLLYGIAGALVCGLFFGAYSTRWIERFADHYVVVPKVAVHAAINLIFIALAPQIGVLLLMVMFIIMSFGALRMGMRNVVIGSIAMSFLVGLVMAAVGDRLALPMATPMQRLLSGLWFALVLSRTVGLGVYGARLRIALAERNAQLAATFEKLEELATHDELTGALNRRCMLQLLRDERIRMPRGGQTFAVALLDIDHFKRINDGFGHQVGDEVLRRFSSTLMSALRATDRFARYGGEEFLLLLTNVGDVASAAAIADRMRQSVAACRWDDVAGGLTVTVSIGAAVCERDEPIEKLLARADAALYEAKRDGRDRVRTR